VGGNRALDRAMKRNPFYLLAGVVVAAVMTATQGGRAGKVIAGFSSLEFMVFPMVGIALFTTCVAAALALRGRLNITGGALDFWRYRVLLP
jgi:hypothetical protein